MPLSETSAVKKRPSPTSLVKFLQEVDLNKQFSFSEEDIKIPPIEQEHTFEVASALAGALAGVQAAAKIMALRRMINEQRKRRQSNFQEANIADVLPQEEKTKPAEIESESEASVEVAAPAAKPEPSPTEKIPQKATEAPLDQKEGEKVAEEKADEGDEEPESPAEDAEEAEGEEGEELDEDQAARDLAKEKRDQQKLEEAEAQKKPEKTGKQETADKVKQDRERETRQLIEAQKRQARAAAAREKERKKAKLAGQRVKKKGNKGIPLIEKGVDEIKPWPGTIDYWWASVADLEAILELEIIETVISFLYINAHAALSLVIKDGIDELGLREWAVLGMIDLLVLIALLGNAVLAIFFILLISAPVVAPLTLGPKFLQIVGSELVALLRPIVASFISGGGGS